MGRIGPGGAVVAADIGDAQVISARFQQDRPRAGTRATIRIVVLIRHGARSREQNQPGVGPHKRAMALTITTVGWSR